MSERRKPPVEVEVTTHAREQARARFPGFKAARIVDEVREAICAGRFGAVPPAGFATTQDSLFAWTADEGRLYAVRAKHHAMLVTTTMSRREARAA